MASVGEISKITLPGMNSSQYYDIKTYTDHIAPMMSKTFTGVIGTANDWANATFFFGSIRPTDFQCVWHIKYRIAVQADGTDLAKAEADVGIYGTVDTYCSYYSFNRIRSTSYRPAYYHILYRLKQAGFNNGYGHALGARLYSSWNPTTAANARTFTIQILECKNCTFTFYDSMLKYANIPGTGTTDYTGYTEFNFADNGLQETGDSNGENYYNRIYYDQTWKTYTNLGRYMILFQKSENQLLPVNATNNTTAAGKALTTQAFNPFGQMFYYAYTTTRAANAAIADNALLYRQYYLIDLRYSFNTLSTLTANKAVYVVTEPQGDGSVKLHSDPIAQDLPATQDGLVYIYLGRAFDTYRIEFYLNHPAYWFKDGQIRQYTPNDAYKDRANYWRYNAVTDCIELIFPEGLRGD